MLLGTQIQGDWIEPNGFTSMPVTVYFDLLRLWDSRAVWHKMVSDPNALADNIAFADTRKAQVLFTFGEPPQDAIRPGYNKVPTSEAWVQFVRQTVTEARGRVKYWELWNEPQYPQYWDGTPEDLAAQSRIGYQIIKGIQADATLLSPSFTRVELPDGQAFLKKYIAADGLAYCDAVAWHGYCENAEDLRGQIASLKNLTDKALWNTEYVVGKGLGQMRESLLLQAQLGIQCAVWNAEIPGSEDYTDSTIGEVHNLLTQQSTRKGCNPFSRFGL